MIALTNQNPLDVFNATGKLVQTLEVKSRRVGGANTKYLLMFVKTVNCPSTMDCQLFPKETWKNDEREIGLELKDATASRGQVFKKKKILIEWLKQIKHLHITAGNKKYFAYFTFGARKAVAIPKIPTKPLLE